MARSPRNRFSLTNTLRWELSPYPGRLTSSMRNSLGVLLGLLICFILRVPNAALSLALVFLLQRERPGMSLRTALPILYGAILAAASSLFWVQLTDGLETARFLGLALGLMGAAFCMVGSTQPMLCTVFAMYWFVDMSSWDTHRTANQLVSNVLWSVSSVSIALATSVAVEYAFGTRHPREDLLQEMRKRLTALASFYSTLGSMPPQPSEAQLMVLRSQRNLVIQLAHSGDRTMLRLYQTIRNSNPQIDVPAGLQFRIETLVSILELSASYGLGALSGTHPTLSTQDRALAAEIAKQCRRLSNMTLSTVEMQTGENPVLPQELSELLPASFPLSDVLSNLLVFDAGLENPSAQNEQPEQELPAHRPPFFLPGVFSSGYAIFYALKLTLAAMICYVLYNAIEWPGISTCVITVLFTGLSTTGAMKQKQLFRISGACVGGALGILAISVLFPNMDSITSLLVVVFPVLVLSFWVLRSPRMGYVGMQIGLAFFLTALATFKAPYVFNAARDRVIGVGLGLLVLWFVFDQIWPVRTSSELEGILARIRQAHQRLQASMGAGEKLASRRMAQQLRPAVAIDVRNAHSLESASWFEFGPHRRHEMARGRLLARNIESAAAEFYATVLDISRS